MKELWDRESSTQVLEKVQDGQAVCPSHYSESNSEDTAKIQREPQELDEARNL